MWPQRRQPTRLPRPWDSPGKNTGVGCHSKEYTEELYKKDLNDQDNHNGVITHLEPDLLECEVKWALESITTNKTSGGDGIPVELFQILKHDAEKVLHSICQQNWKIQQWPQHWKRSVFISIPKKGKAKECSNYHIIVLISLHFRFSLSCIGEGNGNHLQCSSLENPKDGGSWWAAVYGVAQSQTWLKWLSSSSSTR